MYLIINEDSSFYTLESITQDEIDAHMNGYISIINMDTKTFRNYAGEWGAIEEWPVLEEYLYNL